VEQKMQAADLRTRNPAKKFAPDVFLLIRKDLRLTKAGKLLMIR
jgi:hypothetical protein